VRGASESPADVPGNSLGILDSLQVEHRRPARQRTPEHVVGVMLVADDRVDPDHPLNL
jgi:hypothetical protein